MIFLVLISLYLKSKLSFVYLLLPAEVIKQTLLLSPLFSSLYTHTSRLLIPETSAPL